MLTAVQSAALNGVEAYGIRIEVDVGQGAQYFLVGLPDNAVRESWKRMESAIRSSGLRMPRQRIVINLAPADRRKQGSGFDLPMALGILAASGQIPAEPLQHLLFLGELALDGSLRPVPGCLSAALYAREIGCSGIVVAAANAMETAMAPGIDVLAATDLASVIRHIKGESTLVATERTERATIQSLSEEGPDFSDVRGQAMPKRALEIAAAGGHNVLMVGPPGSGKTMLARRLPGILPAPDWAERLDITRIYSVAGLLPENGGLMESRPFRAPHHTCSDVSLVGGGTSAQPGEITLAHFGVFDHFYTKTLIASYPVPSDYPHSPQTLAEHLKKTRYDRRISQCAAARVIGVDDETYREWELGLFQPQARLMPSVIEFIGHCPLRDTSIGGRLFAYRQCKGLNKKTAADLLQMSHSAIPRIEEQGHSSRVEKIVIEGLLQGRLPLSDQETSTALSRPLGFHIDKFCSSQNLNRTQLSKKLKVSINTVLSWEKNASQPKLYQWPRIIQVLGYNPHALGSGSLGERLKVYRQTHGLTYKTFNERFGISDWVLERVERELAIVQRKYVLALELIVRGYN